MFNYKTLFLFNVLAFNVLVFDDVINLVELEFFSIYFTIILLSISVHVSFKTVNFYFIGVNETIKIVSDENSIMWDVL